MWSSLLGQSIDRQKIGIAGFNIYNTSGSYDFSIGEAAINFRENSQDGLILSEGYLQPSYQGVKIIGNKSTFCFNDSINLKAYGKLSTIFWSNSIEPEMVTSTDTLYEETIKSKNTFYIYLENEYDIDSTKIEVKTLKECGISLTIYEYITPNEDGKNDVFLIENIELSKENTLAIYDEWGNRVVFFHNYQNQWEPKNVAAGVYVYIFEDKTNKEVYTGKLLIKK